MAILATLPPWSDLRERIQHGEHHLLGLKALLQGNQCAHGGALERRSVGGTGAVSRPAPLWPHIRPHGEAGSAMTPSP